MRKMRKLKKRNTLIVDGDILIHRTAARVETSVCWDPDREIWSTYGDLKEAKAIVETEVNYLRELLGGVHVIITLSPRKTFRHDLYPEYKANRKNKPKPMLFGALRGWVKTAYDSWEFPNLEADDVMGILAKSHVVPAPKIIISADHDMEGVPCNLYKPGSNRNRVRTITYEAARRYHLYQTLTGDSGDNYPGLPGVGPKRAEAILQENTWAEVVEAYESKGLNETEALLQARLAKILTPPLYDIKTERIKLWTP
ncbi:hypothetical protein CMI37_03665 [Candidatus Pacearchaeota archaeon]|nr:hypothetical protein [Candidatus Pacearchaeota archaeon]